MPLERALYLTHTHKSEKLPACILLAKMSTFDDRSSFAYGEKPKVLTSDQGSKLDTELQLEEADKQSLSHGKWPTDTIIDAAHTLLRNAYPCIGELESVF